ncbi:tellurite resistance TerB family protein [Cucumibacter marinus]|uniref:tellurite resistance TerB family protein n=1 Tax=Cucumibacter marinus TaxID=1121252 RepID=UPI0003FA9C45|nr:tellurite resistance TerB family protein [Cucumibacter marinus]
MPLSVQEALIYIMVTVSASDRSMTDEELRRMGSVVRNLPIFSGFDENDLPDVARQCADLVNSEAGLQGVLSAIGEAVPQHLGDTAYAVAMEVAAADLVVNPEEARVLQLVGERLGVDRLTRVAIETAARARHRAL